jgi:hypothetical protein
MATSSTRHIATFSYAVHPRVEAEMKWAVLLVLLLTSGSLSASQPSGDLDWSPSGLATAGKHYEDFDRYPDGSEQHRRADHYFYFVMGVVHTLVVSGNLCFGNNVDDTRIATMVSKYLNANPESWRHTSAELINAALQPTFPCQSGNVAAKKPKTQP